MPTYDKGKRRFLWPNLFLVPSVQQYNPYINGLGSEEYYMNLIADAMEPYLYASGITFTRNNPDDTLSQAIALSNAGDSDFHLALHSNAAPARSVRTDPRARHLLLFHQHRGKKEQLKYFKKT